jgi:hypothetical protein
MSYECPSRNDSPAPADIGHYGLDLCMAVCDPSNSTRPCPLGNYTFLAPPQLLQWQVPYDASNNVHHGIFQLRGQWYLAYHTRLLAQRRGVPPTIQRNVALDAMYVSPTTGLFLPVTATMDWLPQLSWVDPTARLLPASFMAAASDNVTTAASPEGGAAAPRIAVLPAPGAWIRVAGVSFGSDAAAAMSVLVRAAGPRGSVLSISLDESEELTAFECVLDSPDGTWANVSCPSVGGPLTGVHDVFLSLSIASAPVAVAWWTLVLAPSSSSSSSSAAAAAAATARARAAAPSGKIPGGGGSRRSAATSTFSDQSTGAGRRIVCAGVASHATGLYLVAPSGAGGPIAATSQQLSPVTLTDNLDGSFALQLAALPSYACAAHSNSTLLMTADSPTAPCARFFLQGTVDGSYANIKTKKK